MLGYFSESHEGHIKNLYHDDWGFPDGDSGKEPACQCRRLRDRRGFDPWIRKNPWGRTGNPFQYCCLENSMDRVARQALVHRIPKSQIQLKRLNSHAPWWLPYSITYVLCMYVSFIYLPIYLTTHHLSIHPLIRYRPFLSVSMMHLFSVIGVDSIDIWVSCILYKHFLFLQTALLFNKIVVHFVLKFYIQVMSCQVLGFWWF